MVTSVLLAATVLSASPRLAAPEWATVKVERDLATFFSEEFARSLRENGVPVVTAREIASLLGLERQRQLLGCSGESESSCLAELGNALGCDATLLVSVALLDGTYQGNIKVVSTRDGSTLVETAIQSDSSKGFVRELAGAAERIATGLTGRTKPPPTLRDRAWIPAVAGATALAGGAVCIGLANARAGDLDAELNRYKVVTPRAEALAAEGKTFQTVGWIAASLGVAALAGAGAMVLFGGPPGVTPTVGVTSGGASVGVSVALP